MRLSDEQAGLGCSNDVQSSPSVFHLHNPEVQSCCNLTDEEYICMLRRVFMKEFF